jgi:hypothetical protein
MAAHGRLFSAAVFRDFRSLLREFISQGGQGLMTRHVIWGRRWHDQWIQ